MDQDGVGMKVIGVRPVGRIFPAECARSSVLPGVARDVDDFQDPDRFAPAAAAEPATLDACLPVMDDPAARAVRDLELQSRLAEVRRTLALVNYIESFTAEAKRKRRADGIDGRDIVTLADGQGEMRRFWTDDQLVRADEDAAIMYVAQALGWSEYRAARLYDSTVTARSSLPSVWEWFRDARVSTLALGKVAHAAHKLRTQQAIDRLDKRAPRAAAQLRPGELDRWLKRFIANEEPEAHTARFAEAVRHRYVSVRPAEEHDGMSILTALLPTVTAQAVSGKLRAMARSPLQPVPHNPVILGLADPRATAEDELGCDVPADVAAAGYTVSEEDWLREQVEEAFAEVDGELTSHPAPARSPQAYADGDKRSLAQREADLLCAWMLGAEHAEALPIEAHIGLLVPLETLTEESDAPGITRDRSDAVPAPVVRQLIRDPANRIRWHRVSARPVHGGSFHDELDVLSHTYHGYQVPKILREALWFREGVCQAPGCTVAAERGDIDHITPWPAGATRGENLQILCRRHHRLKTAGHQFTSKGG